MMSVSTEAFETDINATVLEVETNTVGAETSIVDGKISDETNTSDTKTNETNSLLMLKKCFNTDNVEINTFVC